MVNLCFGFCEKKAHQMPSLLFHTQRSRVCLLGQTYFCVGFTSFHGWECVRHSKLLMAHRLAVCVDEINVSNCNRNYLIMSSPSAGIQTEYTQNSCETNNRSKCLSALETVFSLGLYSALLLFQPSSQNKLFCLRGLCSQGCHLSEHDPLQVLISLSMFLSRFSSL